MPIKKKKEAAFVLGIAIYLILLLYSASELAPASREFPTIVIITAFLIIALKLLTYAFPALTFLDPSASLERAKGKRESPSPGEQGDSTTLSSALKPGAFIIWVATFPLAAYLVGFLPALMTWLLLFLLLLAKTRLRQALLICVGMFAVIYLVFITILQVRFPSGILF